jgi:hypothetical protein
MAEYVLVIFVMVKVAHFLEINQSLLRVHTSKQLIAQNLIMVLIIRLPFIHESSISSREMPTSRVLSLPQQPR